MPLITTLLFPQVPGLRVEQVVPGEAAVQVVARMTRRGARCPLCRRRSRRVHSRYVRRLADLPCVGRPLMLTLHTRRFVCRHPPCPRMIFTERVPALVAPWARRTTRVQESLRRHGFALGGRPGARHATAEGIAVSPRTVLRLVRATPLPPVEAVRVVGVDDFCRRKGHTYGTLAVDLERHRPVDLWPDRTAETLAAWLTEQPSVCVVSRDRAGAYAEGARQGAPDAVQVADRFHVLCNVSAAAEGAFRRLSPALAAAARAVRHTTAPQQEPEGSQLDPAPAPLAAMSPPVSLSAADSRRQARAQEVRALQQQGVSLSAISRRLGLCRTTVRRYLRTEPAALARGEAPLSPLLRPHVAYLHDRWTAGCRRADDLYQELQQRGYRGSARTLRRFVRRWRTSAAPRGRTAGARARPQEDAPPQPLRLFSPRQTAGLLVRAASTLSAQERAFLERLTADCPEAHTVRCLTQDFHALVRQRDPAALAPWLDAALASGLPEFVSLAHGLSRDGAAVQAALSTPWSQGQVEGQVTRIKLIKRSMYGRCNFDLLRLRVLHRA